MMEHAHTKASPWGRLTVLRKQKQCRHNAPKLSLCQGNCAALCFFCSYRHSFKAVAAASKLSWALAAFIKMLMELPSWHISTGRIHSPWSILQRLSLAATFNTSAPFKQQVLHPFMFTHYSRVLLFSFLFFFLWLSPLPSFFLLCTHSVSVLSSLEWWWLSG